MGFDGVKGVFDDEILRDYGGGLNLFGESSYQKYLTSLIFNPKKLISSTNPQIRVV